MANDLTALGCRVQIPLCLYPAGIDNLINPLASDYLSAPAHDVQHAMTNDILTALERTLGVGGIWSSRFSTGLSVSAANVVTLASDIPTGTTIGSAYVYRVGGTDVSIADGGTNASSFAQSNGLIYYNGTSLVADTAALTQFYFPYVSGTTGRLVNSALTQDAAGNVKWTTGNVVSVPVVAGTALQTACTAASANDVLELGAGTYAMAANTLTPSKALTIRGKGVDTTAITFTSGQVVYTASNIRFENLTISAISEANNYTLLKDATDGLTGIDMTNVKLSVSHSVGTSYAGIIDATKCIAGTWRNVVATLSTSSGEAYGLMFEGSGTAKTIDLYNCDITATSTLNNAFSIYVAATQVVNMYGGKSTGTGTSTGYGAYVTGASTQFNAYMGARFSGNSYDVYEASSAVLSLSNCTLANNTTYGTITHAGTVHTACLVNSGLTSGRITYAGTSGILRDSASLTFNGTTTLSLNGLNNPIISCLSNSSTGVSIVRSQNDGNANFDLKYYGSAATGTLAGINKAGLMSLEAGDANHNMLFYMPTGSGIFAWGQTAGEWARIDSSGNYLLGLTAAGTSATKTLAIATGTAPTTSPADAVQLTSADLLGAAGQATLHVRGEDGNVVPLGMNLVNDSKGKLINSVYSIVTPANVVLFLIFDRTGAVTALKDYSTIGGTAAHTATLSANASTLTPAISGMCPNLTFTGGASGSYFSVADATDLSFIEPQPFSIVVLANVVTNTNCPLLDKYDITTGVTKREWSFESGGTGTLRFILWQESTAGRIGRECGTLTSGAWRTYITTYAGNGSSTGINVYDNAAVIDTGDYNSGSYTTQENTAATVGNYYTATGGTPYTSAAKYGVVLVVKEELSAVQVNRLDAILRAYSGSDLN